VLCRCWAGVVGVVVMSGVLAWRACLQETWHGSHELLYGSHELLQGCECFSIMMGHHFIIFSDCFFQLIEGVRRWLEEGGQFIESLRWHSGVRGVACGSHHQFPWWCMCGGGVIGRGVLSVICAHQPSIPSDLVKGVDEVRAGVVITIVGGGLYGG